MLIVSEDWSRAYPDAHVGILAMRKVINPASHPALDDEKRALEDDLRTLFKNPEELKSVEPIRSYQAYYKHFKKTYHVQAQLVSVAFKGKGIPKVAALVEAMFMEELRNMLLTAGHDLDLIEPPLSLNVARETEAYVRLNGQEQMLKAGDMTISDAHGIISSIIYGPDRRTMIRPDTTSVLFTVYGVPGVGEHQVHQHLQGIERNVRLVIPSAETHIIKVYSA
jgi:DNA/RNA-binding domain of Phe-tRNA-synthetase-like protein